MNLNQSRSPLRLALFAALAIAANLSLLACEDSKSSPVRPPVPPATSLEGAMLACPSPISMSIAGGTRMTAEAFIDGTPAAYHLKRLRHYLAGSLYRPREEPSRENGWRGKAEFRGAGAISVTLERRENSSADLPTPKDFAFNVHCQHITEGMNATGHGSSMLTLDRDDGTAHGEVTFNYRSSDKTQANLLDLSVEGETLRDLPFDEMHTAGSETAAYRMPNGDLILLAFRRQQDGETSTSVLMTELTLQAGPLLAESLPPFIRYFQDLREPARTSVLIFPGVSAVDEAQAVFATGLPLKKVRHSVQYFLNLENPRRTYVRLFSGAKGVNLAVAILQHPNLNFSKLKSRIAFYQELRDPQRSWVFIYEGVKAVQAAFDELGITVPLPSAGNPN